MRNFECSGHQILCDGEPWAWIDSAKWGEDFDIAQFIVDACNEKERREHGVNEWAEEERMPPKAWAANAMAHLKKVIE